jgi:hypothetical protein
VKEMEKAKTKFLKFLIEDNLIQLFNYFADIGGLNHEKEKHYSWVKAHPAVWPNYVYSLSFTDEQAQFIIKELVSLISHDVAPSFLIAGPRLASKQFADIASVHGVRPVMQWSGMAKNIDPNIEVEENKSVEILIVENEKLLTDWLKITENVIFNGQLQHSVCYWEMLKSPFFKLFIAIVDKRPVATTLLFINEKTAGIYMVACLPEFKKPDVTKSIINYALAHAFDAGCKISILQANKTMEDFFLSMGYKEYCRFNIYWKIPQVI